jgi:hypothetical protein
MPIADQSEDENKDSDDNESGSFHGIDVGHLMVRCLGLELRLGRGSGHENIVALIGC